MLNLSNNVKEMLMFDNSHNSAHIEGMCMKQGNRRAGAGQHILELPEYLLYNGEGKVYKRT